MGFWSLCLWVSEGWPRPLPLLSLPLASSTCPLGSDPLQPP